MLVNNKNVFVTCCGPVRFVPGLNEVVKEAQLSYLKTDKSFSKRCELGQFEIIDKSAEVSSEVKDESFSDVSISKLKQADAIKVIKGLYDREKIALLLEDEKRPKVAQALQAQLNELNKSDEKKGEE